MLPEYWQDVHAPLVEQHAASLGIKGYTQLHTVDDEANAWWQASRGSLDAYDGAAEYFVDLDALWDWSMMMRPQAMPIMLLIFQDEPNFADFTRSALWFAEEHVIIDP